MRGSLRFVILSCFIQILVADVTYNVEDVCRGTKKKMGTNDILRRHFSKRQFGAILDIPRSESVVVVLGTHNPSVTPSFLIPSSSTNTKSTKDTSVGRSSLDCRFTLKPPKPGSNVTIATEWQNMISNCSSYLQIIHSPDMLLIRMTESGSYTFTNTLYFPLHVRLSICNNSESQHPGFLLIASGSDDGSNPVHSMLSVFSFLGPCLFLLLIIASAVLACCCYWPASYQREMELSSNDATPRIDSLEGSVIPSTDKPPTYEELFFPKGNGSVCVSDDRENKAESPSPPTYESVRHLSKLPTIHS